VPTKKNFGAPGDWQDLIGVEREGLSVKAQWRHFLRAVAMTTTLMRTSRAPILAITLRRAVSGEGSLVSSLGSRLIRTHRRPPVRISRFAGPVDRPPPPGEAAIGLPHHTEELKWERRDANRSTGGRVAADQADLLRPRHRRHRSRRFGGRSCVCPACRTSRERRQRPSDVARSSCTRDNTPAEALRTLQQLDGPTQIDWTRAAELVTRAQLDRAHGRTPPHGRSGRPSPTAL